MRYFNAKFSSYYIEITIIVDAILYTLHTVNLHIAIYLITSFFFLAFKLVREENCRFERKIEKLTEQLLLRN